MSTDLQRAASRVESLLLPPDVETTAYPVFIMMSGLPGSGKSYLSQRLAKALSAVIVESDRVRKALFPEPTYTAEESAVVHRVCQEVIRRLLTRGVQVIFDATNLIEFQREALYSLAERSDASLLIVRTVAPEPVIKERLERRKLYPGDASDADWQVYRRMLESEQRIARSHLCIDTSQDIDEAIRRIVRAIRNRGAKR
ncbi:MAG: ATP-binding protein [Chloroflexi bacterium]|nr:ATP-binding protein [Chloroflexota bacterium]